MANEPLKMIEQNIKTEFFYMYVVLYQSYGTHMTVQYWKNIYQFHAYVYAKQLFVDLHSLRNGQVECLF